jgi:hypothetical protein
MFPRVRAKFHLHPLCFRIPRLLAPLETSYAGHVSWTYRPPETQGCRHSCHLPVPLRRVPPVRERRPASLSGPALRCGQPYCWLPLCCHLPEATHSSRTSPSTRKTSRPGSPSPTDRPTRVASLEPLRTTNPSPTCRRRTSLAMFGRTALPPRTFRRQYMLPLRLGTSLHSIGGLFASTTAQVSPDTQVQLPHRSFRTCAILPSPLSQRSMRSLGPQRR